MGVSQPAVSTWKSRNYANAIKKRCRELGIYDEIFSSADAPTGSKFTTGITAVLLKELESIDIDEDVMQVELLKFIQKMKKIASK